MSAAEGARTAVPLSGHVLFETDDVDCARERVAQKFCRHLLEPVGERRLFHATHHHVAGEMLSLNYISYGADVLIDPGCLDSFYLVQMPIAGAATIRNGDEEFLTDRGTASLLNADLPTRMQWWQGCRQVLVQVRKAPFLAFVERLVDRSLPGSLIFEPRIDFTRPEMAAWRAAAFALFHDAERWNGDRSTRNLGTAFSEQRLLETLFVHQPSNMALFREPRDRDIAPKHLRRAEEFIRAHCAEPITLLDIAEAAGVTSRTLQLAYKSAQGISPMHALQRERMRRVRFELLETQGPVSIADVAFKWGFGHLGRFAAAYRREFGELPSATLRRGG